jgi:hypothetical protein
MGTLNMCQSAVRSPGDDRTDHDGQEHSGNFDELRTAISAETELDIYLQL